MAMCSDRHYLVGCVKNCSLSLFLSFYHSLWCARFTSSASLCIFSAFSTRCVLLTVGDNGRDVTGSACLDTLSLYASFSCLLQTYQHFASVQMCGDWFWLRTLWLECSVTETLSTELACQCSLAWLTSLWISHSLFLCLCFPLLFSIPPSIFLICLSFPCVAGVQWESLPARVSVSLSVCRMSAAPSVWKWPLLSFRNPK